MRCKTVDIAKRFVPKYVLVVNVSKIVATNVAPVVLLWIKLNEELNLVR
jgi:hypothetical protein